VQKLFKASFVIVLIVFCSIEAFAEGSAPTVSDAHDFLRETMRDWNYENSGGTTRYFRYSGSGCQSSWQQEEHYQDSNGALDGKRNISIDWGGINKVISRGTSVISVIIEGSIKVELHLEWSGGRAPPRDESYIGREHELSSTNPLIIKRVTHAMTLLMNSCADKSTSKFD